MIRDKLFSWRDSGEEQEEDLGGGLGHFDTLHYQFRKDSDPSKSIPVKESDWDNITVRHDTPFIGEYGQREKMREELEREYPSADSGYIKDIIYAVLEYESNGKAEKSFELIDKFIGKRMSVESMRLLEILITEDLKSATRNGKSVFEVDGNFTVRETDHEIAFDEAETELIREIIGEDASGSFGVTGEDYEAHYNYKWTGNANINIAKTEGGIDTAKAKGALNHLYGRRQKE